MIQNLNLYGNEIYSFVMVHVFCLTLQKIIYGNDFKKILKGNKV
jgi:hypothetical protein